VRAMAEDWLLCHQWLQLVRRRVGSNFGDDSEDSYTQIDLAWISLASRSESGLACRVLQ
jgi:hypothetical protein